MNILKWCCNEFGTWSSPSIIYSNHKKLDRNFTSLVALIFLPDLMFYYLIFHLPNFLITLINWMMGSSYSQLRKKSRCSVKLRGGPLDHSPRKIPVEYSWIIVLQNNSKCRLLNDKQMPHEILLSLQTKRVFIWHCLLIFFPSK